MPNTGHVALPRTRPARAWAQGRLRQLSAKSGLMHRSKKGLLDHLVGVTGGSWVSRTAGWEGPNVIFPVWSYPLR